MSFLIALSLSLILIPIIRRLSTRIGMISQPRDDRWNSRPVPTLGGVGIFLAFIISVASISLVNKNSVEIHWGIIIGATLIFFLGLIDDLKHITPQAKLVGQILITTVVILFGYGTDFFSPRIQNPVVAQLLNLLVTYVWIIGITNAINLLDNMDGLAGGISLFAACILSYFFWKGNNIGLLILSLALGGSILGFLFYNFPPASIFMGDSGSLFLGFSLALLAIAREPQASNVFAVLGVPTLIFLIPILDTAMVTITRILSGKSPIQGGMDHTSHRLVAFGLRERQVVIGLYGVAIISGVIAAILESIKYWYSLVIVPVLILSLALLTAYFGGLKPRGIMTEDVQKKTISKIFLDLTFRRHLFEVLLDFFLIGIAYYLAFLVRFGFVMNQNRLQIYQQTFALALAGSYVSFYIFGIYRSIWRYVDLSDLLSYLKAACGASILLAAFLFSFNAIGIVHYTFEYPTGILLLFILFLFLGLTASRSTFRVLESTRLQSYPLEEKVVIYHADDVGVLTLRWILMNPQLNYRPIGFIDDDPYMMGRLIQGLQVLGGLNSLKEIIGNKQIKGVILTKYEQPSQNTRNLIEICHQNGCWVRKLQLGFEMVE